MAHLHDNGYNLSRWTVGDAGQWNNYSDQHFDDYDTACGEARYWKDQGYHVSLETKYTVY